MSAPPPDAAAPRLPPFAKRRAVNLAAEALVEERPLREGATLPLLIESRLAELDLAAWAREHRARIDELLIRHGGILFRGFGVDGPQPLERFVRAASGEALEYRERSSPRTAVEGRIYTSTDYPPSHPIFLHNENSYQNVWPLKIFFCCQQPAAAGGETPIADCRRVLAQIDPEVRDRFAAKGWMYVRNFGDGFGLDWKTVFQTADRTAVEEHCAKSGIAVEWKAGGRLRTRAVRPALARHPQTGEELWFNHATFFNVSTLEPEVRAALTAEMADDDLPANTYYGDGEPIEPAVLDHLRGLYRQETVAFAWQQGDVLLLDNMMVAHGRAPYQGERKILVGMAEPVVREAGG
jgi:alpha-ketoglutarate-dependent taurine dioxygenase